MPVVLLGSSTGHGAVVHPRMWPGTAASSALLVLPGTSRGAAHEVRTRPFQVTNARLLLYRTIPIIYMYLYIRNYNHIIVNKSFLRNLCPDRKCMLTGTETQQHSGNRGSESATTRHRGAERGGKVLPGQIIAVGAALQTAWPPSLLLFAAEGRPEHLLHHMQVVVLGKCWGW